MGWEDARLLWGLLVVPLFLGLAVRSHWKAARWVLAFTGKQRPAWRDALEILLLVSALSAVLVSLAGPKVQVARQVLQRGGIDLLLGIDISKSMLAEDAALPESGRGLFSVPNRLNRARHFALELLSELQGERLGVLAFASQSVELIPFTQDYGFARYLIRHVNDAEIAAPGSDLGEALRTGVALLEGAGQGSLKRMILLTDGEDITADASGLYESARLAGGKGIKVCAIGVGMGRPVSIPIRSPDGQTVTDAYLDEDGAPLRTTLNPESLEKIAALSGGRFYRVTDPEATPRRVVEWILADAGTFQATQGVELVWVELAPVFLLSGIGLAAAAVLVKKAPRARHRPATAQG